MNENLASAPRGHFFAVYLRTVLLESRTRYVRVSHHSFSARVRRSSNPLQSDLGRWDTHTNHFAMHFLLFPPGSCFCPDSKVRLIGRRPSVICPTFMYSARSVILVSSCGSPGVHQLDFVRVANSGQTGLPTRGGGEDPGVTGDDTRALGRNTNSPPSLHLTAMDR